jgi:hypothetical protein
MRSAESAMLPEIFTCLSQAQVAIRPSSHNIDVVIVLSIVLPKADWANILATSFG